MTVYTPVETFFTATNLHRVKLSTQICLMWLFLQVLQQGEIIKEAIQNISSQLKSTVVSNVKWNAVAPGWGYFCSCLNKYSYTSPFSLGRSITKMSLLVLIFPIFIMIWSVIFFISLHGHASLLLPALPAACRVLCCSVGLLLGRQDTVAAGFGLVSQLIFPDDAAFLITSALRISPVLLLTRGKDGIEDHASVMHHGRDYKHVLPLQASLLKIEM